MSTIVFEEAITFLASFAFVWFEVSQVSVKEFREYYEKHRSKIWPSFPGAVFGIVWFAIKIMIVLAMFFYLRRNATVSVSIFALWVVNEVLRKYWTYFFMDMKQTAMALFVCLGILGTGLAVLILLGLGGHWLPFGLLVFYNVWVAFACILNIQWWNRVDGGGKKSKSDDPLQANLMTNMYSSPSAAKSSVGPLSIRASRLK